MSIDFKQTRFTLFLRLKKDDDIRKFLEPELERNDFSSVVRGMIRELMKYRQGEVFHRHTSSPAPLPQAPKIERKPISKEEFAKDFEDF
jgi:hypothetical protein